MQISRRDALMGASAAVVVAGVPGAAQGEDAHLEALHAEYRAAEARHDAANSIADDAMGAVYQSLSPQDDYSSYLSGEAISADLKARDAEKEAAIESSGAGELKRRANAAHAVSQTAFFRFMEAPAQTPRGLRLKFEAGIDEDQWEERADYQYYENVMLRAIRADLERLAGEA